MSSEVGDRLTELRVGQLERQARGNRAWDEQIGRAGPGKGRIPYPRAARAACQAWDEQVNP